MAIRFIAWLGGMTWLHEKAPDAADDQKDDTDKESHVAGQDEKRHHLICNRMLYRPRIIVDESRMQVAVNDKGDEKKWQPRE